MAAFVMMTDRERGKQLLERINKLAAAAAPQEVPITP
jgi:hypothetical protein